MTCHRKCHDRRKRRSVRWAVGWCGPGHSQSVHPEPSCAAGGHTTAPPPPAPRPLRARRRITGPHRPRCGSADGTAAPTWGRVQTARCVQCVGLCPTSALGIEGYVCPARPAATSMPRPSMATLYTPSITPSPSPGHPSPPPSRGPTCGRNGCITPASSGGPQHGDKQRGQEGDNLGGNRGRLCPAR